MNEDYYKEIDRQEFINLLANIIPIDPLFYKMVDTAIKRYRCVMRKDGIDIIRGGICNSVYSLKDEWFLVHRSNGRDNNVYYRCDQVEGLIKCIRKLK